MTLFGEGHPVFQTTRIDVSRNYTHLHIETGGTMQSFDSKSALNPLCSPIYRYSGQQIYAVHEVVDESLEIIRQLHSQPNTVTGYPTGLTAHWFSRMIW
jgi:hypothetical protein